MEQEEDWKVTNCRRCLNRCNKGKCRDCSVDPRSKKFYKHYVDAVSKKGIKG